MSFLEEKKPDVLQYKEGRKEEGRKEKERKRNRGNTIVICKEKLMRF